MVANENMFLDIYEKYKFLMFSIAMDVLQDKFSAEDAVQNAFVKILNNCNKIDDLDSKRTKRLIITITKNSAIDIYRKRNILWNREMEIEKIVEFPKEDFLEICENDRFSAIDTLSEKYKEVLILKYSAGFSNREIAEILNISEMSVRKRISRAKKQLENNMKMEGVVQYE